MGRVQAHAHRSGAKSDSVIPVPRVAAMPWIEILTLAIGAALIVTMICSKHA